MRCSSRFLSLGDDSAGDFLVCFKVAIGKSAADDAKSVCLRPHKTGPFIIIDIIRC